MKHFIANEEERNRTEISSNVNDRAMHELYLHPFLRSVMADVSSAMCSYNLVRGRFLAISGYPSGPEADRGPSRALPARSTTRALLTSRPHMQKHL